MPAFKVDCWNCGGEGFMDGDCTCGEDCCCCADPIPPACSMCFGTGYLVVTELTEDNAAGAVELK